MNREKFYNDMCFVEAQCLLHIPHKNEGDVGYDEHVSAIKLQNEYRNNFNLIVDSFCTLAPKENTNEQCKIWIDTVEKSKVSYDLLGIAQLIRLINSVPLLSSSQIQYEDTFNKIYEEQDRMYYNVLSGIEKNKVGE